MCWTLQVVALHKERYVFPVTLKVTRVSGTGVDAIFMGVMKVSGLVLLTGWQQLPSGGLAMEIHGKLLQVTAGNVKVP